MAREHFNRTVYNNGTVVQTRDDDLERVETMQKANSTQLCEP